MISRPRARIGIDARLTRQMSAGMQRYARELSERLPVVAPEFEYAVNLLGGNFGWSEQVALPMAIAKARVELVHFLAHYVPVFVPARFILTIHDLIHLRFPQYFKRRVGPYYRTIVRRACAKAERVITDDERTVEDLQRFLGVDPKKVRVIPLGVTAVGSSAPVIPSVAGGSSPVISSVAGRNAPVIPSVAGGNAPVIPSVASGAREVEGPSQRQCFLNVGNHRTHKNLQTLLDAWQSLPEQYDVDLCFTGNDDFGGALERASTERRKARVLGDLSEEALARAYRDAVALVHPSLREGFGLPMLEAMSYGTPVIASSESAPSALASAVLAFPAGDVRALANALAEIVENQGLRARLVNQGEMLAQQLTWDRCARETALVYHEVLG